MPVKIVMKVQMNCGECRKEALGIAAGTDGVDTVSLEGDSKEKLVVSGDKIDPVKMVKKLRKKVGHTEIISLN